MSARRSVVRGGQDTPRYELESFAGLTPTTRKDVSRLYDRTNTVRENTSNVISRRVGGDTQYRRPGILVVTGRNWPSDYSQMPYGAVFTVTDPNSAVNHRRNNE